MVFILLLSHLYLQKADTAKYSSNIIMKVESILSPENKKARPDQLIYFYFSFDDALHQDLEALLKSIITQLCPKDDVLAELRELFQNRYPTKPSSKDLRSTLMSSLNRLYRIPENLWDYTTNTQRVPEIYLVFDGLDEIPYGNLRNDVLELLSEMSSLPIAEHIHILVTSRIEIDISNSLKVSHGWQHYKIQDSQVENDIALYISSPNRSPSEVKLFAK